MKTIEKIYQQYKKRNLISTDSRKIDKDCVFVAIKGERFDGNDYALQVATDKVASCVIADRKDLTQHERIFIVDDSVETLQRLAKHHREQCNIPVIGITGTNGKTTTKELVSAVISQKYNIINTQGNFNNHIGVPLTLLQIKPETEIAIVEMGANHPNEIAQLCEIAQPNYGIITNIGKAHIEGFGSLEGVIKTKNELYAYLKTKNGKVFVNHDNDLLVELSQGLSSVRYGTKEGADIKGRIISSDPYLTIEWNGNEIKTNLVGEYNFENVMVAITVGYYFNVDENLIINALENYHPTNNRSQFIKSEHNEIVMDAYNANPTSMQRSLNNFRKIAGDEHLLILGDMRELGNESEKEHRTIVELINRLQFSNVILVGEEFKKANKDFNTFSDIKELIDYISENPIRGKKILVKGSHSMHLEQLSNIL